MCLCQALLCFLCEFVVYFNKKWIMYSNIKIKFIVFVIEFKLEIFSYNEGLKVIPKDQQSIDMLFSNFDYMHTTVIVSADKMHVCWRWECVVYS